MFFSTSIFAAAALTGLVSAQDPWTFSTNYSTSGAIAVDPSTVSNATKESWCLAEHNSCGEICGTASNNTCDYVTLTYNCTCASGITPNISNYAETLPSLICEEWIADCVDAHPNDLVGIEGCRSVTCGTANASDASSTSSSSSSAASSTSKSSSASSTGATTTTGTATSTASTTSSTKSSAAMALSVGKQYGGGFLAAGMLAAFGLAL